MNNPVGQKGNNYGATIGTAECPECARTVPVTMAGKFRRHPRSTGNPCIESGEAASNVTVTKPEPLPVLNQPLTPAQLRAARFIWDCGGTLTDVANYLRTTTEGANAALHPTEHT